MRHVELKYNIMKREDYDLVKELKYFKMYILQSKIVIYIPNSIVKETISQPDSDGKRGKWITKIVEYEVEIKPTKLIKG